MASCHIGGAAPDAAIDRSFIAAALAARKLEEFLSHRPARTPSPAGTDSDSDSDEGAARAGRSSRHGTELAERGAGPRSRGAAWSAVRGCCATVEVLSGAGRRERRGDDAVCAEHGAPRAGRALRQQPDEPHRREPCACCQVAFGPAEAAGALHRVTPQVGTERRLCGEGGGGRGARGK